MMLFIWSLRRSFCFFRRCSSASSAGDKYGVASSASSSLWNWECCSASDRNSSFVAIRCAFNSSRTISICDTSPFSHGTGTHRVCAREGHAESDSYDVEGTGSVGLLNHSHTIATSLRTLAVHTTLTRTNLHSPPLFDPAQHITP